MTSRNTFLELRISQASVRLMGLPENPLGSRMISLERIGSYEIRMVEVAQDDVANASLFWMELFDRGRQSSIDSCGCHEIEAAVAAYEDFIAQAKRANELPAPDGDAPQG
jgi:hypothetical protein